MASALRPFFMKRLKDLKKKISFLHILKVSLKVVKYIKKMIRTKRTRLVNTQKPY